MALLSSPTDAHSAEQAYARRWWTLAVLCLSLLIVFGGNSTLNVALPTLSRELGATESQLQWVVAAYSLVFAGMLFTSGALGDRFGRKGALQLGLGIFFVASLVASQATDTNQIIACRAVMGLGAAFIMPSTLSILVNVFPPGERAKAIAIWATTTGIAGSIGPIITGYVLGHFWFGSAFLVYLPVIALALVGGWFVVPKSRDPDESQLDPIGALLSILVNVFPPGERAKAIAIWATTTGIAGSIGPIITGYVLGHFWFGSAFLVYLPVIALALVGGWFVVPKSRDPDESQLDPIGALLSIVGVSTLVFGLIQAPQEGWGAPVTLGAFAIAAFVLAVFAWWEMHTDEPMLDMHYFRNPAFSVGSGAMMLVFLAMYGVMFLMTQYFQLVLGFSALGAALRLVPIAMIMLVVTPLTPRITYRFGANRAVSFGMALIALGFFLFTRLDLHTPLWFVWLALVPLMTGVSMSMSPMTASIMSAVPESRAGAGSAMNDATREFGAALGIAVLGSIAASQYSSHLHDALARLPSSARDAAGSSLAGALHAADKLSAGAADVFVTAARTAFVDGIHVAAIFGVALALIASFLTRRFLPRHLAQTGAMHSPVEALENAAEFGIGGAMPVFPDEPRAPEHRRAPLTADTQPTAPAS